MKDRIMMVLFVIVTGTILTGSLVYVNAATTPIIERNAALRLKKNVLVALAIPVGQTDAEIEQTFASNVEERSSGGKAFFKAKSTGDIAFEYTGSGLWGPIRGAVSVNDGFAAIRGLTVFHQEETPGLGSRITEAAYLALFQGKKFASGLKLVPPGKGTTEDTIDSISGATMTCNAFIKILNDNLGAAATAFKGGTP
jgi:Na+-transporting NADH:ubiquinone oxidoreductase subunit C